MTNSSDVQSDERLKELAMKLAAAVKTAAIYPPGHSYVQRAITDLSNALDQLFVEREQLTLGVIGKDLVVEHYNLLEMRSVLSSFVENLKERQIEKVTFLRGLQLAELAALIEILSSDRRGVEARGSLEDAAASRGISHIKLGRLRLAKKEEVKDEGLAAAQETYAKGVELLQGVFDEAQTGRKLDVESVQEMVSQLVAHLRMAQSPLKAMRDLRSYSEYAYIHAMNVGVLTMIQAQSLGIDEKSMREFALAAILHDIGVLFVPREILDKPDKLTEEEFKLVQRHPIEGAKFLRKMAGIPELPIIVAFEHHMNYDLSGYPKASKKRKLNLCTLMTQMAAVYDAMRCRRPYHGERRPEAAVEEMRKLSGASFEPTLLERFIRLTGVYPPGTMVKLDTGEIGLVYKTSTINCFRPLVQLLVDAHGEGAKQRVLMNLMERDGVTGAFRRTIIESIAPAAGAIDAEKYLSGGKLAVGEEV